MIKYSIVTLVYSDTEDLRWVMHTCVGEDPDTKCEMAKTPDRLTIRHVILRLQTVTINDFIRRLPLKPRDIIIKDE